MSQDEPDDNVPDEIRSLKSRPDFGVRAERFPSSLAGYFVESAYEDEVRTLITAAREDALVRAEPLLHKHFGCDARLMLAALWRLKEPIGPVLTVVIYSNLTRPDVVEAHRNFMSEWPDGIVGGINFAPQAYEDVAPHRPLT